MVMMLSASTLIDYYGHAEISQRCPSSTTFISQCINLVFKLFAIFPFATVLVVGFLYNIKIKIHTPISTADKKSATTHSINLIAEWYARYSLFIIMWKLSLDMYKHTNCLHLFSFLFFIFTMVRNDPVILIHCCTIFYTCYIVAEETLLYSEKLQPLCQ